MRYARCQEKAAPVENHAHRARPAGPGRSSPRYCIVLTDLRRAATTSAASGLALSRPGDASERGGLGDGARGQSPAGLRNRYSCVEQHAANPAMSLHDRLFWFREQMARPADPLAGGDSLRRVARMAR